MTLCAIALPVPCDNHSQVREFIVRQFNTYFGGSMSVDTTGSWVSKSDNGKETVIYEPNVFIMSYTDIDMDFLQAFMKVLGETVKEMTNELSVMTVIDTDATFH